jgi:hypothetical protein
MLLKNWGNFGGIHLPIITYTNSQSNYGALTWTFLPYFFLYFSSHSNRLKHGTAFKTFFKLVGRVGLEPTTKGLCLPLRLSPPVSSSWSGLYLAFRPSRRVSTRSPVKGLRSVLALRVIALAFTEFEKFYVQAELTCPGQPI